MYSFATSVCSRVFKNGNYFSVLRQLMAVLLWLAIVFSKKPIYYLNRHFMLSRMVFVQTLYIKVSVSNDCVIKHV